MILLLLIYAGILLYQCRLGAFHQDYMGREQTGAVKGIFAAMILLSHVRSYLTPVGAGDELYCAVLDMVGQLMVAPFFFYSGYGILEAFRTKSGYAAGFFKNRILKTLVHFDLAVLCYMVLSLILGTTYKPTEYLLSLVGWTSIGNSNWFIFDMLALYVLTLPILFLFQRARRRELWVALAVTAVTAVMWLVMREIKPWGWATVWYNTILCYPLGFWFSLCKPRLDRLLGRKALSWAAVAAGGVLFFALMYMTRRTGRMEWYSLYACGFVLFGVLITAKLKVGNRILHWLGEISFSLYIFQRIPMIILERLGLARYNFLFCLLAIALALLLAEGGNRVYAAVDKRFFAGEKSGTRI